MHKSSHDEMAKLLDLHDKTTKQNYLLVDVGSYNVNGSYKDIIPANARYIGCDLVAGPNVDIVMPAEYSLPFDTNSVDVVISGQCIEHCRNPFKLVTEMARILRPGGKLYLTAPFVWREHRYPIDTFRYLPDGFKALFDEAGLFTNSTWLNEANNGYGGVDCWGIASKPSKD